MNTIPFLNPESKATMIEETFATAPAALTQILDTGGSVVAILLLMALIALTVFLVKCLQLWKSGVFFSSAQHRSEQLISSHKDQLASAKSVSKRPFEAEKITSTIISLVNANKRKSAAAEASRLFEQHHGNLRSHLSILELIASLAPSLGLLGTVLGMIEAFQAMELAGREVDPSVLSGGIWQALLTTAVGLSVAMPTIVMLSWLNRRLETYFSQLDNLLSGLINQANAEQENNSIIDKAMQGTQVIDIPSIRHAVV